MEGGCFLAAFFGQIIGFLEVCWLVNLFSEKNKIIFTTDKHGWARIKKYRTTVVRRMRIFKKLLCETKPIWGKLFGENC